jgi:hypothetical protein
LELFSKSKDNFPLVLITYRNYFKSKNLKAISLCLTILEFSKTIKYSDKNPDFSSIKDPSSCDFNSEPYRNIVLEITTIINNLGLIRKRPKFREFHLAMKAGPNGPAVHSNLIDLWILVNEEEFLLSNIKSLGGENFCA